ncbi:hypothetical protein L2703_03450 [Shewanella basaltis]|uniref:hypothetical protein n=1 Tax=Shewanella basaltis TaxID=472183 RepID=UPI00200C272A|nr:hypothetical protein [Shewanella basaltis]MCL1112667.1 hypothetical protein [Shewanella basaltis]
MSDKMLPPQQPHIPTGDIRVAPVATQIHTQVEDSHTDECQQNRHLEYIRFNHNVTPFISAEHTIEDDSLKLHQQQVADDIQLQFSGAVSSSQVNNTLLLSDEDTRLANTGLWQKGIRAIGEHSWLAVFTIHLVVILIALIFGRVDISGLDSIPLEPKAATSLPPLKSYLITEAQYNKLVERAQQSSTQAQQSDQQNKPNSNTTEE